MQAQLYANPMFASGLSDILGQALGGGNPLQVAQSELAAAKAGEVNDTARYREAAGQAAAKHDLAAMLAAFGQAGPGYGSAAPQIASAMASLPEFGFDDATQGRIQVGTGTQEAKGTFAGMGQWLGTELAKTDRLVAGDRGIAQMKIDADRATQERGFDAFKGALDGYVGRLGQIESGWKGGAQNPNSSAGGYFQWTDGTANQYGVTKGDLASETAGLERFTLDNAHTFEAMLGRAPQSEAELYLMHQQGAGGAAKLLGNPSARAVDVVGRDAVLNNGGNEGMSAGQFAQHVMGYYGGGTGGGGIDPRVYGLLLGAGTPGVNTNQSRILSGLADDWMAPESGVEDAPAMTGGGRSLLLSGLGKDMDPATAMHVVTQTEGLMREGMPENDAIAYALQNLESETTIDANDGWWPGDWFTGPETATKVTGIKPRGEVTNVGQPGGIPSPTTPEEFAALPSGTKFKAPDGTMRIKP
ncbi:hypothetical protein [uncultured Amaricoccus sp.]|uniref:hypothetical protein n=1 Tax=uncultured Amaricoccus sp. TaxID=339341 RepID=UPI002617069C|nr:hypothetical protein [uncultured Amaricoccus sp.]